MPINYAWHPPPLPLAATRGEAGQTGPALSWLGPHKASWSLPYPWQVTHAHGFCCLLLMTWIARQPTCPIWTCWTPPICNCYLWCTTLVLTWSCHRQCSWSLLPWWSLSLVDSLQITAIYRTEQHTIVNKYLVLQILWALCLQKIWLMALQKLFASRQIVSYSLLPTVRIGILMRIPHLCVNVPPHQRCGWRGLQPNYLMML